MANNCDFSTKIIGSSESLQKLYNRLKEQDNFLSYENYNKIFDNQETDDYDWGSKWQNLDELDYTEGDGSFYITGYSAWSPTIGLWEKISLEYDVEVNLEYSEPGCDFAGFMDWKSGELMRDDEMTWWKYVYQYDNEYFWDNVKDYSESYTIDELWDLLDEVDLTDDDKSKIEKIYNDSSN